MSVNGYSLHVSQKRADGSFVSCPQYASRFTAGSASGSPILIDMIVRVFEEAPVFLLSSFPGGRVFALGSFSFQSVMEGAVMNVLNNSSVTFELPLKREDGRILAFFVYHLISQYEPLPKPVPYKTMHPFYAHLKNLGDAYFQGTSSITTDSPLCLAAMQEETFAIPQGQPFSLTVCSKLDTCPTMIGQLVRKIGFQVEKLLFDFRLNPAKTVQYEDVTNHSPRQPPCQMGAEPQVFRFLLWRAVVQGSEFVRADLLPSLIFVKTLNPKKKP